MAPILIALPILVATHGRFPLTSLVYALLFVHAVILMVGGAYTYARVLLGFWLEALLHTARIRTTRLATLHRVLCRRW